MGCLRMNKRTASLLHPHGFSVIGRLFSAAMVRTYKCISELPKSSEETNKKEVAVFHSTCERPRHQPNLRFNLESGHNFIPAHRTINVMFGKSATVHNFVALVRF